MTQILVIHAHPEQDSFGSAVADAYVRGARAGNHVVREILLRDLEFDPILHSRAMREQQPEPSLAEARESILWCNHLVLQYPTWWASTPALLKGFIDRVFVPGFAYQNHREGSGWDKLLAGRSARMLVTMDVAPILDSMCYFASSRRSVSTGVLGFCGIRPARTTTFGPVRTSSDQQRSRWLEQVQSLGRRGR